MLKRLLGLIIFLLIYTWSLSAQSVKTYSSTDSVSVGDIFDYSIVLQLDGEYDQIIYPDTSLFPSNIELSGRQQFKLSAFTDSVSYHFQFFGTEDVTIPSLPIELIVDQDSVTRYTDPITLYYKPLVEEGDTSIKPLKPIFDFPRPWWPWILAAILLASFLVWWFKFREEPEAKEVVPKPEVPPFQNPIDELEKRLEIIKADHNVAETQDFKSYYSSISDAIRWYYEELYKIPALESTSRELLRYLDAYGADQQMIDLTRKILNKSDLVKFAKFTPTLEDAQITYQLALAFLERAKETDDVRISRLREQYEEKYSRSEDEEVGE